MSFYKSILTIGGLTLGSRLLGFARDILTANFLGAGPVADAFFIALKLPNFFRRITAEGAFSVSFVPMFSRHLAGDSKTEAMKFAEEAQAVMLAVLIPFTVLAIVAMPWVLYVVAPGVQGDPARYDIALELSRITFPYILMMSLVALLGGVMNSFDRFGPFAAAPIFFNATLIVFLVLGVHVFPSGGHALAVGVAVAGVVQFLWMLWHCSRIHCVVRLRRPRLTPDIRKLFRLMVPGVIGAGAAQINLFVDMILASLLPAGAISFLYYADRLYQLPLGVIGIAIGTALLPMLSRSIKSGTDGEPEKLLERGIETSLILAVPAAVALVAIPMPIMSVLFERGAFHTADSVAAAHALTAYALGLPAYVLAKVFSTAYFAREDTYTPVKFAILCAVINTTLALALIGPLKHAGIALATGITAWVNLTLLYRGLDRRGLLKTSKRSEKRIYGIIFSGAGMAVVLMGFYEFVLLPYFQATFAVKVAALSALVVAGGVTYFFTLYVLGIFNLAQVKDLFPKRRKKATIEDVQRLGQ